MTINIGDIFQVLKSSTIQIIFKPEWDYVVDHRWDIATNNPQWLILLDSDHMSLHHLDQIQRLIQAEKGEKVRAASGASLTGSHRAT
jgi:hypothetical protein